jgi:hypothetical protein
VAGVRLERPNQSHADRHLTPVRGVAQAAQRRACLQGASARVGACAAVMRATLVILARRSVPERVRLIADLGAVTAAHHFGCRMRFSMLRSRGRRPPCLLRLLRPESHLGDTDQPDPSNDRSLASVCRVTRDRNTLSSPASAKLLLGTGWKARLFPIFRR